MADWVTISSLATAGGTLVLAVATFSAVRSANRSARVAERTLLAGLRPVLVPSRDDDPDEAVRFGDAVTLVVGGHAGALEVHNDRVYVAMALRNGGSGLAIIHGWRAQVSDLTGSEAPPLDGFRRQQRDLYIPAGDTGFWQGAVRERSDPYHELLRAAESSGERVLVDVLYGDYEGGQRTIARFGLSPGEHRDGRRAEVVRYWNVDTDDPRSR